jgi:hypothetical protein
MKRKNKIIIFICGFVFMLISNILLLHNFSFKGREPMSMEEIIQSLWLFIIISMLCSLGIVVVIDDGIIEYRKNKNNKNKNKNK